MNCPCIILEGAHFLTREHGTAVNALLKAIILPNGPKVRILGMMVAEFRWILPVMWEMIGTFDRVPPALERPCE